MEKYNTIKMFGYYTKTSMRSWFQYKLDACLRSFAVLLREATAIIALYFTLLKFDTINGWNINEMMFLFSFIFLTYGIMIIFFTGLRDFNKIVTKGDLDRFILRPRGVLFQILSSNSDWFAAIGHGTLGIILFSVSAANVGIVWNFTNIIYVISIIFGGVLIQGAIFLFTSTCNFYFLNSSQSLESLFYRNGRKVATYPISIFKSFIQYFIIFIVPFAFVNYFPAEFLMNKVDNVYPEFVYYLAPFVGIAMYALAYIFWRIGLKHYKSAGN
ncbi:MAG: ABC-2 family transporter protein [Acholeplasmatales bacterium]|nr:ABC-2 family transporter protein [Acholeplasmatales bacterium]